MLCTVETAPPDYLQSIASCIFASHTSCSLCYSSFEKSEILDFLWPKTTSFFHLILRSFFAVVILQKRTSQVDATMSGRRLIVTKQVHIMTVAFLLLCVLNFWTLQVMSQDPLAHRHHWHHLLTETRESSDSHVDDSLPSSHSPNKRQASLVNQHALLQVQVSIECSLEQRTTTRL